MDRSFQVPSSKVRLLNQLTFTDLEGCYGSIQEHCAP